MTDLSSLNSTLHTASIEGREIESINFHDSLRFFQEQLHLNGHTYPSPSTNLASSYEVTSKYNVEFSATEIKEENLILNSKNLAFEDTPKTVNNCRISIPTVDTILESVRVLRAIQKSQEQRGTTWSLSKVLSSVDQNFQNSSTIEEIQSSHSEILCESSSTIIKNEKFDLEQTSEKVADQEINRSFIQSCNSSETIIKDILNTSNESTHFWPSNKVEVQKKEQSPIPYQLGDTKLIDHEIPSTIKNKSNPTKLTEIESQLIDEENCSDLQNYIQDHQKEFAKNETGDTISSNEILEKICLEKEINSMNNSSCKLNTSSNNQQPVLESNTTNLNKIEDLEKCQNFQKQLNSLSVSFSEVHEEKENYAIPETNSTLNDSVTDLKKHSASSLRPDSGHGSCSSYDVLSGCSSPNHILECISGDCDSGIAYSSSPLKEQKADGTLNEWTTEWLESRVDTEDEDSRIQEVPSSLSTASITTNIFEESSLSEKLGEFRCHSSELDAISGSDEETNENKLRDKDKVAVTSNETNIEDSSHATSVADGASPCSPKCAFPENIKMSEPVIDINNTLISDGMIEKIHLDTVSDLIDEKFPQGVSDSTNQNSKYEHIQNISDKNSIVESDTLANKGFNQAITNSNTDNINNETVRNYHEENLNVKANNDFNNDIVHQMVTNSVENNESIQRNSIELLNVRTESSIDNDHYQDALNYNENIDNNNLKCNGLNENVIIKSDNLSNRGSNSNVLNSSFKEANEEFSENISVENIKSNYNSNTNILTEKIYSNEEELDLYSNKHLSKPAVNGATKIIGAKKFITSSWDLVSIVKILYNVGEPQPPQVFPEDSDSKRQVFLLSKGAFSLHPEGNYNVLLKENFLHVIEANNVLLSLPLKYAEIHIEKEDTLVLDNKMGRFLHMKCDNKEEFMQMKAELELCSLKCWQEECINLVHYPLKCHKNIVVIDLGSCSTRAGILMDQPTLPALFFPSVCATSKTTGKHVYGLEALQPEARQNSTISFPLRPSVKIIKHNIDIDKVCGIFKMIFRDLKIEPSNYAVQVCLPRSLSINAQNDLLRVLLEDLNVQSVSLAHQAILTLYAHNVSTGIVVDVGDRMDILPVIDGFIVETGVTRLPYGGQRLIHHMKHALAAKHISLSNDIDSFVVQYITENLTYIAEDYDRETDIATAFPDTIRKSVDLQAFAKDENCFQYATLDEARFKVPEGLFNPDLWGLDCPGIHKLVQKAIQTAGVDGRRRLAENIYVSGGVTLTPGFVERLRKEVTKLNEPRFTPKVYASNYRYHSTYIGACRFARMDVFPQVCVDREEYARDQMSSLKKFMLCV